MHREFESRTFQLIHLKIIQSIFKSSIKRMIFHLRKRTKRNSRDIKIEFKNILLSVINDRIISKYFRFHDLN